MQWFKGSRVIGSKGPRVQELVQGFRVQGFKSWFEGLGFKGSHVVEGRRLYELKYVDVIHFLGVVGPSGRVRIFLCLKP